MSEAAASLDMEHLRSWIGREERRRDVLTEDLAAKFHATLDLPGEAPKAGEPAPDLIHFCLAQPAVAARGLGRDGHPERGGFLPPVALPRRMWAGGEFRFHAPLRVGDTVSRVSRIADVAPKSGRSGPLCFVRVEHAIRVGGALALEETQTIVYRGEEAPPTAEPAPLATTDRHRRELATPPTLLFRYSALTFNGHRIHYDRRYAQEIEHYPGLVVHGPLQATLLCHLAAELRGRRPSRFSFRSLSSIFDDDGLVLHATDEDGALSLWTARPNGPVAMSAKAHFE